VDLDGAMAGDSRNGEAVGAILKATDVAVQVGGGIRTREQIEAWLDRGAARVVLGTAAVNDPDMVERAAADYPDAIVVALDSRQGEVVTEGWRTGSGVQVNALAERFDKAGVAGILCTDVERDGVMAGPDLEGISALIAAVSAPVLASGGVATLDDLMRLQSAGAAGAVVGRAFYENRLDVREVAAHFANAHRPG
jgi:phosphoribosylformimino-5-aminoimidazole carboxamide ribotide isomerase